MASSVGNGCGRPLVLCCIRVSMGWGTSFGSDLWHALNLCVSCCYVTPRVTPFAQTHPVGKRRNEDGSGQHNLQPTDHSCEREATHCDVLKANRRIVRS